MESLEERRVLTVNLPLYLDPGISTSPVATGYVTIVAGLHPNGLGNQHFARVVRQSLVKVFGDSISK